MKKFILTISIACLAMGCNQNKNTEVENTNWKLPPIFNTNNFSITTDSLFRELYTTSIDEHGDMTIMQAHKNGDEWTQFVAMPFSEHDYNDIDPFLSRDGQKLYFISNRENGMFENDDAIWVSERDSAKWGAPKLLSEQINFDGTEGFPSVAANGNIYFPMKVDDNRDIYVSKFDNGEYSSPEKLPETINSESSDSNPAISGDESVLVFYSAREGGFGESDLYISKKVNGEWTPAKNLGENINSKHIEYCPYITHDNKTLFYTRWDREKNIRFMVQASLSKVIDEL